MKIGCQTIHATQAHCFGKHRGGDACGLVAHQLFPGQHQELGLFFNFFSVPALKAVTAAHVRWQLLVIKGKNQFVIYQHVLAPCLVLQVLHLLDQLEVRSQKRQRRFPLPVHQRFTDKYLSGAGQINLAVIDPPPAVDHQAIERGPLQSQHLRSLFFPMRIEQLFLKQVFANLLQPLRVNRGDAAAKQTGRLYQLCRHNPAPWLFGQMRPRVGEKLDASGAQILPLRPLVFNLAANVSQQTGKHGQMQLIVGGRAGIDLPLVFGNHRVQLAVDVFPFANAANVDKVLAQQLFILAVGKLVLARRSRSCILRFFAPRLDDPFPQLQVAAKFAAVVIKLGMCLVGLGLGFHRSVAHVLHTQGRCDYQNLIQGMAAARLQNHPPHPWV